MNIFNKYLEESKEDDIDYRAGLIPCYKDKEGWKLGVMIPSNPKYGGTEPQFPKGHIKVGQTPEEAAIDEGSDEFGYQHKNKYKIQLLWHNKKQKIYWFLVVVDSTKIGKHGTETKEAFWIDMNKAKDVLRDWQKPLIKMIQRKLGIKE